MRDINNKQTKTFIAGPSRFVKDKPEVPFEDIQEAVDSKDVEKVTSLLSTKINQDSDTHWLLYKMGSDRSTLLQSAVWNESLEIVQVLLDSDISKKSLRIKDNGGYTPLHAAVHQENFAIIKLLLDSDETKETIKIKAKDGNTPLHTSGFQANMNIFSLLIDNDVEFEETLQIKNMYNMTLLEICMGSANNEEFMQIIEERRQIVNQ